jgi:hypothetical protein
MRMMLKFTLPVEKSNTAIHDGSLGKTMESILNKLKPEAAYFAPVQAGQHAAYEAAIGQCVLGRDNGPAVVRLVLNLWNES